MAPPAKRQKIDCWDTMDIEVGTPAVVFHVPRLLIVVRSKTIAAMHANAASTLTSVKFPQFSVEAFESYAQVLLQDTTIAWDYDRALEWKKPLSDAVDVYLIAVDLKDSRAANKIMNKLRFLIKKTWPRFETIKTIYDKCPTASSQLRQLLLDDFVEHPNSSELKSVFLQGGAQLWEYARDISIAMARANQQDEKDDDEARRKTATYHIEKF